MLLAIDVGNSQTVVGLVDRVATHGPPDASEITVREHWRVGTQTSRTSDEWLVLLEGLLANYGDVPEESVEGVAICSTVPAVLREMRAMVREAFGDLPCLVVAPGVRTGLQLRVENPREVGADRIVNSLAARELYGGPAIVVDCGTATTFDVLAHDGAYVGGAIAPGVGIAMDALGDRGAQLPKVELVWPRSVVAKNTVEALQSGVLYGFVGQVDGIVNQMIAAMDFDADSKPITVVTTGGLAPLLAGASATIDVYEPMLTLIGLRLLWERNLSAERDGAERASSQRGAS